MPFLSIASAIKSMVTALEADPAIPEVAQTPDQDPLGLFEQSRDRLEMLQIIELTIPLTTRLTGDIKNKISRYEINLKRGAKIDKSIIERLRMRENFNAFDSIAWSGGGLVLSYWNSYSPPPPEPIKAPVPD